MVLVMKIENIFKWPACARAQSYFSWTASSIPWAPLQTRWIDLIISKPSFVGIPIKVFHLRDRLSKEDSCALKMWEYHTKGLNKTKSTKERWVHTLCLGWNTHLLPPGIRTPCYWTFVLPPLELNIYTVSSLVLMSLAQTAKHYLWGPIKMASIHLGLRSEFLTLPRLNS